MKVFVISDTHFPFHSKRAYNNMLKELRKERPDAVVQIGDLLDQYVFSKYSKKVGITPKSDVVRGLEQAAKMWKDIRKHLPKSKCYQILGNHDMRHAKRLSEMLPEFAELYSFVEDKYKFPGVKVMKSDRDFLVLDGVIYAHGWLSKSIDHAKYFNAPTVHGHRHRPTIETDGPLWSMDVGYMADHKSVPLTYTATKYSKWVTACGVIDNRRPKLIFL